MTDRITVNGLTRYLLSEDNLLMMPNRVEIYQDMTQPLSHYFINSSHNTYLVGELPFKSHSFTVWQFCHFVTQYMLVIHFAWFNVCRMGSFLKTFFCIVYMYHFKLLELCIKQCFGFFVLTCKLLRGLKRMQDSTTCWVMRKSSLGIC